MKRISGLISWFLRNLRENRIKTLSILAILFVLFLSASYVAVEATSTPSFCVSCHEIESAHASWLKSSHYDHKTDKPHATCRDCHVRPWSNPLGVIYDKTYHGIKDSYYHLTKTQEELMLPGSKQMRAIKASYSVHSSSCLKCHDDIINQRDKKGFFVHRNFGNQPDIRCTSCHKNLVHN